MSFLISRVVVFLIFKSLINFFNACLLFKFIYKNNDLLRRNSYLNSIIIYQNIKTVFLIIYLLSSLMISMDKTNENKFCLYFFTILIH
jgi:hypothetical protein